MEPIAAERLVVEAADDAVEEVLEIEEAAVVAKVVVVVVHS